MPTTTIATIFPDANDPLPAEELAGITSPRQLS